MKIYRTASIIFVLLFAVTGLLFLAIPEQVINLFNNFSAAFGLPEAPLTGFSFYLILAVGYMYLVTLLAFFMYRRPENRYFPQLLAHAKIASSLLSFGLFIFHAHYLIYLANFIIDGIIGAAVIFLYVKIGSRSLWASR
jgi:hypothetical protein